MTSERKTFKNMWIMVSKSMNGFHLYTLSYYKKDCIAKLLEGSKLTWKEVKEQWECKKVNVTFQTI